VKCEERKNREKHQCRKSNGFDDRQTEVTREIGKATSKKTDEREMEEKVNKM
jgi:hypothetical protein